jgi:transcriptional regulator with XRE-family HTH domain
MDATKSPEETLGQRIRSVREKSQLSQDKFGESLGVSRQTISRWEKEKVVPELANLMAICRAYHVKMAYLIGQEEEEESEENPKVWDDERKLRKILLSSAIVVAVMGMLWAYMPLFGIGVCICGLVFSRKWKMNSIWLDGVIIFGMLMDAYNIYVRIYSWMI